jgi:hypothetical protein
MAVSLGRDALKGPTNRLLILEPEAGVEDWSAACWQRRSAGIEQHQRRDNLPPWPMVPRMQGNFHG